MASAHPLDIRDQQFVPLYQIWLLNKTPQYCYFSPEWVFWASMPVLVLSRECALPSTPRMETFSIGKRLSWRLGTCNGLAPNLFWERPIIPPWLDRPNSCEG
jgi:hypothetical protein